MSTLVCAMDVEGLVLAQRWGLVAAAAYRDFFYESPSHAGLGSAVSHLDVCGHGGARHYLISFVSGIVATDVAGERFPRPVNTGP